MSGIQRQIIKGGRLHLNHGPIDLIINASGPDRELAFERASTRFHTVLDELASELSLLRSPINNIKPKGIIARKMWDTANKHPDVFVTPMASVAGAVADEICQLMCKNVALDTAYVNNGGDISFYLNDYQSLTCAMANNGCIELKASQDIRGLATSGWQGRSHSLGIANSVTVLAKTAADADIAATLIANAVNLENHPEVKRQPANELAPDSDLKDRLVTISVGILSASDIHAALTAGQQIALKMISSGLITAAALSLKDQTYTVGDALHANNITGDSIARLQIA